MFEESVNLQHAAFTRESSNEGSLKRYICKYTVYNVCLCLNLYVTLATRGLLIKTKKKVKQRGIMGVVVVTFTVCALLEELRQQNTQRMEMNTVDPLTNTNSRLASRVFFLHHTLFCKPTGKVDVMQLKGDLSKIGDFFGFEHWWKHFG